MSLLSQHVRASSHPAGGSLAESGLRVAHPIGANLNASDSREKKVARRRGDSSRRMSNGSHAARQRNHSWTFKESQGAKQRVLRYRSRQVVDQGFVSSDQAWKPACEIPRGAMPGEMRLIITTHLQCTIWRLTLIAVSRGIHPRTQPRCPAIGSTRKPGAKIPRLQRPTVTDRVRGEQ